MSGRFLERASERIIDIGAEGPDDDDEDGEADQAEADAGNAHDQGGEHVNAVADENGRDA